MIGEPKMPKTPPEIIIHKCGTCEKKGETNLYNCNKKGNCEEEKTNPNGHCKNYQECSTKDNANISHGNCPDCHKEIMENLKNLLKKRE